MRPKKILIIRIHFFLNFPSTFFIILASSEMILHESSINFMCYWKSNVISPIIPRKKMPNSKILSGSHQPLWVASSYVIYLHIISKGAGKEDTSNRWKTNIVGTRKSCKQRDHMRTILPINPTDKLWWRPWERRGQKNKLIKSLQLSFGKSKENESMKTKTKISFRPKPTKNMVGGRSKAEE